jgi:hypothetical protein
MRLHFCESCGQQFSAEGDLPQGKALCPDCREKQGAAPAPAPRTGRTNTMLRASNPRGSSRQRSGHHPADVTHGRPGLSQNVVWGGIIALAAMIAVLLLAVYLMRSPDQAAKNTNPRQQKKEENVTPPEPTPNDKPGPKADEVAFDQLMAALGKLPEEDRASRLAKLEDFVKRYPDSFYAPRARTMISTIQKTSGTRSK